MIYIEMVIENFDEYLDNYYGSIEIGEFTFSASLILNTICINKYLRMLDEYIKNYYTIINLDNDIGYVFN